MAKGGAKIYLLIWIKKDLTSVFFFLRPGFLRFFQFLVKVPKFFLTWGAIVYTRPWPSRPEGHAAASEMFWYYIFKSI